MKIYIGADHRGFQLKKEIIRFLEKEGYTLIDKGTHHDGKSCDYPQFAYEVAKEVAAARNARGILVCMTGIGHAIAANKVRGAYAALCYNKEAAALSRQHNNSNILVLGAKFVSKKQIRDIIVTWLRSEFEAGRHARRVRQIKDIEKTTMCKN